MEFGTTGRKMILVWKVCLHSNERSRSWKNRHLYYTPSVAGGVSRTDITLLTCLLDRQKWQPLTAVNENLLMDQFHIRAGSGFPFSKILWRAWNAFLSWIKTKPWHIWNLFKPIIWRNVSLWKTEKCFRLVFEQLPSLHN